LILSYYYTAAMNSVKASPDSNLIWSQTSNPSTGDNVACGVAVDVSGIYIVGHDSSPGNLEWRIEKRTLQLALAVTVTVSPTTIYSGGMSTIRVFVASEGTAISGATVSLTSSQGGAFSAVTDYSNGTYTATFTAPDITTQTTCNITATASKSGYTGGSGQTQVTVQPLILNIYVKDADGKPIVGATVVSTSQPSQWTRCFHRHSKRLLHN
jgi:hypothetical protein